MRKKIAEVGAPPVPEFLQMLVNAGAKLHGCRTIVDMMGLKKEDFIDGVIDIVSASTDSLPCSSWMLSIMFY